MPNPKLLTRRAEAKDLPRLAELYRHLNPEDPPISLDLAQDIFARLGQYSGSAIFLACLGQRLVASCTLIVIPNLTRGGRPYGLIENVVTDAEFRGQGAGTTILHAAADAAWQADCYKLMLLTGTKKSKTLDFYRRAGFEQSKTGFQMRRLPPRKDAVQ